MQLLTYQTFSMFPDKEMTFRISIQDGTKLYLAAYKLYKMRVRGSVQLQTVLAVYDQEMDRNRAVPSFQRLKTVRRHIDLIGTWNFKAGREERGVCVNSQREKVSVEIKVGEYQWRAGQCKRRPSQQFQQRR